MVVVRGHCAQSVFAKLTVSISTLVAASTVLGLWAFSTAAAPSSPSPTAFKFVPATSSYDRAELLPIKRGLGNPGPSRFTHGALNYGRKPAACTTVNNV
jgi:hypothetical protein